MNIKSVKKYNNSSGEFDGYKMITTDDVVWAVPLVTDNTDYQAILKWVAEGNTIEEAD